ncbi:MAG: hypothetical protein RI564_09090 [Gracilimonas sp.]|nr:hypothetical protein [Gracilimonas sp.]
MKTLKTILSVFAIAAVFSAGAYAQETADVEVTAEVVTALTLTPSNIDLGTIQTGAASILDANSNDDATEANIGTSASAGSIQIDGSSGASIDVSWTNATLDNGTETLTFTPSVWNGSSELTTPGGTTETISGGSITLDVGGELDAPSGSGTYDTTTGTGEAITFTVQYN